MGELADIYVAVNTRSKKAGENFLNQFLPIRTESAVIYEFPQYSKETEREFKSVTDLMKYMEKHEQAEYNLYWRNLDETNPNKHGMLFYTRDKAIIFGLSREIGGHLNTKNEDECLELMKEYFKTDLGYITYEDTPTATYREFVNVVNGLRKNKWWQIWK